jgi:hypothetical protein
LGSDGSVESKGRVQHPADIRNGTGDHEVYIAREYASNAVTVLEGVTSGEERPEGCLWTTGLELAKLARNQGQRFESATRLHKARQMHKAEFQQAVEKELTGKDSEPSELIYFKVYKSQIPVIEQASEVAGLDARLRQVPGLLPGDDLCRLPLWAHIYGSRPDMLLRSISRSYRFLPPPQREIFLSEVNGQA